VSWLVQHDVDEGRATLNFSEWTRPEKEAKEAALDRFVQGLAQTFGAAVEQGAHDRDR
jgi:hypothetical protein